MSTKRDIFYQLQIARAQATSFLHRDKPSGAEYQAEADRLLAELRAMAAADRERV